MGDQVRPMSHRLLTAVATSVAVAVFATPAVATTSAAAQVTRLPDVSLRTTTGVVLAGARVAAAKKKRVYVVTRKGANYKADVRGKGRTFRGTLKYVMQRAAAKLQRKGGGKIRFTAGTFNFGNAAYVGDNVRGITFAGAGMQKTIIRNSSDDARDTEPFNFHGAQLVRIRNLTVSAGGAPRTTSDALDFDKGSRVTIKDVKVNQSRGRGIVFDGKDTGAVSTNNQILGCVIRNIPSHGIELLAVSNTTIEDCTITNAGRSGIVVAKSSPTASQPNKKSIKNFIRRNRIHQSGEHGVLVLSSDDNRVIANRITNSSDDSTRKDGIRVDSADNVTCDDNVVTRNTAVDTQKTRTQTYGVNIASPRCHRTVLSGNTLARNLIGRLNNDGTNTM